jgi:hypothetical protein
VGTAKKSIETNEPRNAFQLCDGSLCRFGIKRETVRSEIQTQLEKFTMNSRCAPEWIGGSHRFGPASESEHSLVDVLVHLVETIKGLGLMDVSLAND